MRSISPFSLKLETWLRLAEIPYINVYTRRYISYDMNVMLCSGHWSLD